MRTIFGKPSRNRFCDGLPRRDFLKIGGMVLGGLSLPQLLRTEAQSGAGGSHKAIINIFLPGGPPHQDMWDIKLDAPSEIRGEFRPIKTNVPGIEICELFPLIVGMMDKFVPIRSIVGCNGTHDAFQFIVVRAYRQWLRTKFLVRHTRPCWIAYVRCIASSRPLMPASTGTWTSCPAFRSRFARVADAVSSSR